MPSHDLLHVASPRGCNSATNPTKRATPAATPVQQRSLKALARNALARSTACNAHATNPQKPCDKPAPETPPFVASDACIRNRLLTIARELDLPDALVLELPPKELTATVEQCAAFEAERGERLGRRLLVFYLRSLAGIEPALLGAIGARKSKSRRYSPAQLSAMMAERMPEDEDADGATHHARAP